MRKILTIALVLFMAASVYSQHKALVLDKKISSLKDDNISATARPNNNFNWTTVHNSFAPTGTVPFPINYDDYWTNGNAQRSLIVKGDTIIVGSDINPSLVGPPPTTTDGRVYYQVSYDGGLTWLPSAVNLSPGVSNRWPNFVPVLNPDRSIVATGRIYDPAAQMGVAIVEASLGNGVLTTTNTPNSYRDFWGYYKNSTTLGGIISSPNGGATDSLYYYNFNYVTNTYSGRKMITTDLLASFRYFVAIADNGQNILAGVARLGTPYQMWAYESTNGGTSFSAGTVIHTDGDIIDGDSTGGFFHGDMVYKPNSTTKGMAFITTGLTYVLPSNYKVLYWNGTTNKVVCDWRKYYYLHDTSTTPPGYLGQQQGASMYSHPTVSYSDDGSVLYCAFSAIQKDTSSYVASTNYNYNDIFICWSTDDGNTWSPAYYVTKTSKRDELYPVLSKTGNTSTTFNIMYSESGSPGCFTFTQNAPGDTVYTVFKRMTRSSLEAVSVGVQNISTEVPAKYSLSQNYPNPFNPTTNIKFDIVKTGFVSLKIYDLSGREISNLVNEKLGVGSYKYSFDGAALSSGIYFYTLRTDGFTETKKMMLIK